MNNKDNKKTETILTFKDVDDRLLMTKNVYGNFRVSNIKKINPEIDDLNVEIIFPDIPLFDKVELYTYELNNIRLIYEFDLNQLISENIDDPIFDNRINIFDSEIRKIEKEFLSILEITGLSIYWGGPDYSKPDTPELTEISYYFDDEIGFMLIQQNSKSIFEFDNLTIENIYDKSKELSQLVKRLISKTK